VPKAIVVLRRSNDGYGKRRDSSIASAHQLIDLAFSRGMTPVLMGSAPIGLEVPCDVIDLTGHWRRVSDLPAQVQMLSMLAQANVGYALGQMSGLLDLIHLGAGIPVAQIGPQFRMGMWQDALGCARFRMIEPRAYDANSAHRPRRRYDTQVMSELDDFAGSAGYLKTQHQSARPHGRRALN
jgi:hypothetical protein